jgi:Nif-specific regulatory protein
MLTEYPWPGNIRELENCIEYAAILEPSRVLSPGSLPDKLPGRESEMNSSLKARLTQAERQILLETLSLTNGVKKRAATLLGIDCRNFSYFLHKHGIQ